MLLTNVLSKILVIALLVLTIAAGAFLALSASNNHRGVEKNVIYTLLSMEQGMDNIYSRPDELPYAVTQYMPLGYTLSYGVNKLLGNGADDGYLQRYKATRLTSMMYWLFFGLLLFRLLQREGAGRPLLHIGLVVTMMVMPIIWLVNVRPDMLLLLFNLITLTFVLNGLEHKDGKIDYKQFAFAGLFAAFALLTKQDGLFLGALTGLYLLLHGKFKAVAYVVAGGIVGLLVVLVAISPFVNFPIWFANMQAGVNNGFYLFNAIDVVLNLVRDHFIVLLLAGGAFAAYYVFTTPVKTLINSKPAYLIFVLLGLTALYGFSSFKNGSGVNYLLSPLMVSTVIIAYVVGQKVKVGSGKWITAAAVLLAFFSVGRYYYTTAPYQYSLVQSGVDPEASVAVVNKINTLKAQDADFSFFSTTGFVILSFPQDAVFPHNDITRHADPSMAFPRAASQIEAGKIKYVISPYQLSEHNLAVLAGVDMAKHYTFMETIDGYNFYCHNLVCAGLPQ